ncbi:DNA polymerase I [Leptolyngbya sp. 15MV]|nr:DNA polymerase I [Leptolyngbya sp. 15MV]
MGDVLALMGDSVDNVPGIYGIGPKTASKLIQDHGSLVAALDAAPEMKPGKLRERLIEGREMALLSRELVQLKEDCDLPIALDDMKLEGVPSEPLAAFLARHGFTSLLRRLDSGSGSPERTTQLNPAKPVNQGAAASTTGNRQPAPEWPAIDRAKYECVQTEEALTAWIERAFAARLVAVDTETSALDAMRADLAGISLATGPGEACYIPLAHGGSDMFAEKPEQLPLDRALALLKPLLESEAVLKVGQNIKYDLNVLSRHGIDVAPIDDTMIVSFALDAGRSLDGIGGGHGMDELSERHLGHTTLAFKDVCGTGKKAIPFGEVPLAKATEYAAEDAEVTWRLHRLLHPRLAEEGGSRVYQRVDRPLIPVVAQMERHGIKVDKARLAALSEEFAREIARIEQDVFAAAGMEFTIGSPKQLGDVLFDKLGYKGGRKGKSGQYSTDQAILEGLAAQGAEVATKVLEWRQLSKLKSTYTDALQAAINPDTGRVHTSYSLVGAQTGRLSSTDPNLQNIPIRTEIGRQIREAFVADEGNVLLSADYSQIELRLAAHMADVPQLKEAFANGEDIHARTAREMYGEVTRDTRARAKTINFAILYGISRWGLGGRLGIEPDEAQGLIDTYFARFPGIQRYIMETLESVRERGYSETLFGRKTWFPRIGSRNQAERQGSERAAINAPIQGTSADIIKRAMARMMPALDEAGLGHVRMLLQVHDDGDRARQRLPPVRRRSVERAFPDNRKAVTFQRDQRVRGIGQQFHLVHAQPGEDLRADAIVAQRVHAPGILALQAADLVRHEGGGRLRDHHDHARAFRADDLHRPLQRAVAGALLAEDVVEDAQRVHPHQRGPGRVDMTLLEHDLFGLGRLVVERDRAPFAAPAAGEPRLVADLGQVVVLEAIGDQVADRADLQFVPPGEGDQVVHPRHAAILVHDLADHARGVEAGQPRDVDRGLGMPGADQHAAIAGDQREHVAGGDDVVRRARGVDRDADRARAVGGADPGGDAFARLDADGEGGLVPGAVVAAHQFELQLIAPRLGHRQADQPLAVGRHEVDRGGCGHLGGDHQVALVLAVLVVDQHEHPPVARLVDDLLDAGEDRAVVVGEEERLQLAERVGGGVPCLVGAIAQRIGVEPGGTRDPGARHRGIVDQVADAFAGGLGAERGHARDLAVSV